MGDEGLTKEEAALAAFVAARGGGPCRCGAERWTSDGTLAWCERCGRRWSRSEDGTWRRVAVVPGSVPRRTEDVDAEQDTARELAAARSDLESTRASLVLELRRKEDAAGLVEAAFQSLGGRTGPGLPNAGERWQLWSALRVMRGEREPFASDDPGQWQRLVDQAQADQATPAADPEPVAVPPAEEAVAEVRIAPECTGRDVAQEVLDAQTDGLRLPLAGAGRRVAEASLASALEGADRLAAQAQQRADSGPAGGAIPEAARLLARAHRHAASAYRRWLGIVKGAGA